MRIDGFPTLWFPPLTFYKEGGVIDYEKMTAHLRGIRPFCKGVLVPGSTGDGWVLSQAQLEDLVRFFLRSQGFERFDMIIGALMPTADETLAMIRRWCEILREEAGLADDKAAMDALGVKAFVFCVPAREQDPLRQKTEMGRILDLGLPMAFYQLPLVTGVTVAPEVIAELAAEYPNLIAAKDSGGKDEMAKSGVLADRLMLLRGAEGDPTEMLFGAAPGDPYPRGGDEGEPVPYPRGGDEPRTAIYDGLLLSTVNCFAREYCEMMQGKRAYRDFGKVIGEVFSLVKAPVSNAFSDAVRAICHVQEFGRAAAEVPCYCYNGEVLAAELIEAVEEVVL